MQKLNRYFTFRLRPKKEEAIFFNKNIGSSRFVFNGLLEERTEVYEKYKHDKELLRKQKHSTPAKLKEEYPFLKEVDSLALANAQINLNRAFTNFFRGDANFPRFKSKNRDKLSYTTNNQGDTIRIERVAKKRAYIKLPKLKNKVRIIMHREIPEDYKIKSATITQLPSRKYEISILTEFEKEVKKQPIKKSVGLDFAMRDFFVSSDGKRANYPRYYRKMLEKLAKEQRILSRREKGSNRWEKQRIRVTKIHEKVKNQRKDFLHKLSRQIADRYDAVLLEDINLRDMSQALNFGKSIADNGFGMFREFLEYKLEEQGKVLQKIDKWYPSSKKCSFCGEIKEELNLSDRIFDCEVCGYSECRDINAAKNIRKEGLRLLS